MRRYDAILFDFDGVLIDSEPLHFACWQQICRPLGIELDWPIYTSRLRGHSGAGLIETLRNIPDPPLPFDEVNAIYPAKNDLFRERALAADVMSGAVKALLESLGGMRKAIVSSARATHVEPILARAGARHYFEALVCREDVSKVKPDPEPYLTAAAKLGVERPLVVEDSEAGAESGRRAGFDVLLVQSYESMPVLLRERLNGA